MKKKLLSVVTMFAILLTTANIPVGAVTTPATNTGSTASVHTEEEPDVVLESSISLEETVGGYTITVSGNIPENVYLEVIHLPDTGTYEEMINDTGSYITRQVYEAFDITLWQDDLEWQPADYDTTVTVSIKGAEVEAEDVMVHRIDEEAKTIDALECEVLNDGSVEFETEHFTIYTIDGNGYDLPETCSVEAGVLDLSKVTNASELNETVKQLIEENASLDAIILSESVCFTEEVTLPATFTVYSTNNAETTYTSIPTTLKGVTLINTGNLDELTDIGEKTSWNISTTEEPLNVFLFQDGTLLFDGEGKSMGWNCSATYDGYSYTDSSPRVYYSYSTYSYSGATYAYSNWKTKKTIPWSYGGIREKITQAIVHSGIYTTDSSQHSLFRKCTNLTDVTIHCDMPSATAYMFFDCTSLEHVSFDGSFANEATTGDCGSTFYKCSNLKEIHLPNGAYQNVNTGSMYSFFYGCKSLTSVTLPDGFGSQCTGKMNYFFYKCSKLTDVTLPDGFAQNTSDISFMFYQTGLLNLDLPANFAAKATSYGCVFDESTSLHTITIEQNETVRDYTLPSGTYYIYDETNKTITDTVASYLTPKTDERVVVTKAYNLHNFAKDHSEGDYDCFVCSDCGLEVRKELASSYTIKFPTSIELTKSGETYTGKVYVKATGRISSEDSGLYITFPESFSMTAGDVSVTATITPPETAYFDTLSSTESTMTATIEAPLSQAGEYSGSFTLSWEVK